MLKITILEKDNNNNGLTTVHYIDSNGDPCRLMSTDGGIESAKM